MDLKTLMEAKPEDLALLQFRELKKHVINVLQNIAELIKEHKFREVKQYLVFSSDNYFINFSYISEDDPSTAMDLYEIIEKLERLHRQVNGQ